MAVVITLTSYITCNKTSQRVSYFAHIINTLYDTFAQKMSGKIQCKYNIFKIIKNQKIDATGIFNLIKTVENFQ